MHGLYPHISYWQDSDIDSIQLYFKSQLGENSVIYNYIFGQRRIDKN